MFLKNSAWAILASLPVADLRGGRRGRAPPRGSKFFQFHAVFGKFWQNRMLAPPLGSWRPLHGEILDPPLLAVTYFCLAEEWHGPHATILKKYKKITVLMYTVEAW